MEEPDMGMDQVTLGWRINPLSTDTVLTTTVTNANYVTFILLPVSTEPFELHCSHFAY